MRLLRLRRWRRRLVLLLSCVVLLALYLGHTLAVGNEPSQLVPAPAPEDVAVERPAKAPDGQTGEEQEQSTRATVSDNDDDSSSSSSSSSSRDEEDLQDPRLKPMVRMAYDTSARPPIQGLATVVAELPVELTLDDGPASMAPPSPPSPPSPPRSAGQPPLRRRRFVFVGDVHGQRRSLDALLDKVGFSTAHDHLVLTGDLVDKGPDSAGVVQLAMDVGASAVRGSHDDRILLAYKAVQAVQAVHAVQAEQAAHSLGRARRGLLDMVVGHRPADHPSHDDDDDDAARQQRRLNIETEGRRARALARLQREEEERRYQPEDQQSDEDDTLDLDQVNADLLASPLVYDSSTHGDDRERAVAASLSPEQYRWLSNLPTILHIGRIALAPTAAGSSSSSSSPSSSSSSPPSSSSSPPSSSSSPPSSSSSPPSSSSSSHFDDVVVVHGGLVPGLELASQDPMAVMMMRSLVHPADEVRRERARTIVEYEARLRARGRLRPGAPVYVSEKKVDLVFHKLQHAVYGPDLHHPLVALPSTASIGATGSVSSSSLSSLLVTSPSDLVLLPVDGHCSESGQAGGRMAWAAIWNKVQHAKAASEVHTTVIYGHDAETGLAVPPQRQQQQATSTSTSTSASTSTSSPGVLASLLGSILGGGGDDKDNRPVDLDTGYTFGLDSGCAYGNQLTALIVEAGPDGSVQHYIEQVDCPKNATL